MRYCWLLSAIVCWYAEHKNILTVEWCGWIPKNNIGAWQATDQECREECRISGCLSWVSKLPGFFKFGFQYIICQVELYRYYAHVIMFQGPDIWISALSKFTNSPVSRKYFFPSIAFFHKIFFIFGISLLQIFTPFISSKGTAGIYIQYCVFVQSGLKHLLNHQPGIFSGPVNRLTGSSRKSAEGILSIAASTAADMVPG